MLLHPRPLPRPARAPRRLARQPAADPGAVGDRHRRDRGSEDDRRLRVDDHPAHRVALHRRPDAPRHQRPAGRLPAAEKTGRIEAALELPLRGLRRLRGEQPIPDGEDRRRSAYPSASVISPSDPSEHALEAFAQVVANLGWDRESERSSSPTPTSRSPTCASSRTAARATGTPAAGSTSPTAVPSGLRALPPIRLARHRHPDRRRTERSPSWWSSSPTSTPSPGAAAGPTRYLMKSISSYLGRGHRSSATTFSSLSAASRTSPSPPAARRGHG